jgi:hypothetical protein
MLAIMQQVAATLSALPSDASALDASISALKSSISAIESSLETLEGSSTPWEWVAIVSSFLVALGVAGELAVIVADHRDDLKDWKRGIFLVPSQPSRRRFWFDIVATLIVAIGVIGEAGASLRLASINSQLRSKTSELRAKSDQLLALITQQAGSAASSAERAEKAAQDAGDELLWRGDRDVLIGMDKEFLKRRLTAFKGQKAIISLCMDQYVLQGNQELPNVGGAIDSILTLAHWKSSDAFPAPKTGLASVFEENCSPLGNGIGVEESEDASVQIREAAKYLSASLDVALRQPGSVQDIKAENFGIFTKGQFHPLSSDTLKVDIRMHSPLEVKIWAKGSLEEILAEEQKKQAAKNQPTK